VQKVLLHTVKLSMLTNDAPNFEYHFVQGAAAATPQVVTLPQFYGTKIDTLAVLAHKNPWNPEE